MQDRMRRVVGPGRDRQVAYAYAMSKTLLIVYHTLTGGTLQMAQAAAGGADDAEDSLTVRLVRAPQAARLPSGPVAL